MKKFIYRGLPIYNVLLKRLGAERSAVQAADEAEVYQPEEIEEVPLPISLPGQLDLIKDVSFHSSLAEERTLAQCRVLHHAPVIRYTLKNCLVASQGVEYLGGSMRKRSLRTSDLLTASLQEVQEAHYAMSPVSHRYFGHFLTDACPNALLVSPGQELLLDINPLWPDAADYAAAFLLSPARPAARLVRKLTFYQDHGQGSHKRARYDELRRRASAAFGVSGEPKEVIYLRRGSTGVARLVADEDRLVEIFSARGIRIVSLQGASPASLAKELRNAQTVISMEGSHINHVYFLAPQGVNLCVLMPEDMGNFIHRGLVNAFGGRFGYVTSQKHSQGYRISADDVLRTIDLF